MSGIIQNHGHKLIIINGMPDHVHILFGMRPVQSLADLMQDVKGCSSKWINENKLTPSRFEWQSGYGAFSYSKSLVPNVCRYIANQEVHHSKKTFAEEYLELLKEFDVEFDERYIFRDPE